MAKEVPDHHDAELVLRVYDLRRERVLRESRDAVSRFWPRSFDDVKALLQPDHPLNAPFRQVGTYWEMVYGMVRHGIVHAEYFMEYNGEGLYLLAKLEPYLEALRLESGPQVLRNAEWVARETKVGQALLQRFRERVQQALKSQGA